MHHPYQGAEAIEERDDMEQEIDELKVWGLAWLWWIVIVLSRHVVTRCVKHLC